MMAFRQLYEQYPYTYLNEISSLQENLQKTRLTCKLLHKIAIEYDKQLRANF
jgi:hypothetical protein